MTESLLTRGRKARIVLTTFGSLGDLHPYIAIALGLKARGHEAVLATSGHYRQKIEALGIGFRPVRPDLPDLEANPGLVRRLMDRPKGTECVIRELIMPALRESYEDTLAAAEGADLLVSHTLTFTTRLVAEKKGVPWASTMLQPLGFLSIYDPPVLPLAPFLAKLRFLGPVFHRLLFGLGKRRVRSWFEPWHRLRAEIGLPPTAEQPAVRGPARPVAGPGPVLESVRRQAGGLASANHAHRLPVLRPGRRARVEHPTGSLSGRRPAAHRVHARLVGGEGRRGVLRTQRRRRQTAGRRAVLLVGKETANRPDRLPDGVVAFDYVPFSELFPRAAAIVHQGGIGTTAQAMRSGRPMLVVPLRPRPAGQRRATGPARNRPHDQPTSLHNRAGGEGVAKAPFHTFLLGKGASK